MLVIDENTDYGTAMNRKIGIIQSYLTNDLSNIEYIIYIYGFADALIEYRARFGNRDIEPSVLMFDLATLVIDNSISIYEVLLEVGNYIPEHLEDTDIGQDDDDDFGNADDDDDEEDGFGGAGIDISSIYCENPTEASLESPASLSSVTVADNFNAIFPTYSSSVSDDDCTDDYNDE